MYFQGGSVSRIEIEVSMTSSVSSLKDEPAQNIQMTEAEKHSFNWRNILKPILFGSVEDVAKERELMSEKRSDKFRKLILNSPDYECIPFYWSFAGFGGTLLGMIAVTLGFILWPTDDSVVHQSSWYQCMF